MDSTRVLVSALMLPRGVHSEEIGAAIDQLRRSIVARYARVAPEIGLVLERAELKPEGMEDTVGRVLQHAGVTGDSQIVTSAVSLLKLVISILNSAAHQIRERGYAEMGVGPVLTNFGLVLQLARAMDDEVLTAATLHSLGVVHLDRARVAKSFHEPAKQKEAAQRALEYLEEAHGIVRRGGDSRGESRVLVAMAYGQRLQGDSQAAERTYEAALGIHRRLGDLVDEIRTLRNLSDLYSDEKRFADAAACYERVIALSADTRSAEQHDNDELALTMLRMLDKATRENA